MDRAEGTGLGIAAAGHVVLFGALSLGLLTTSKPKPPMNDPMEVQLVDEIGLRSAMPAPAIEPPAPSEAPEIAKPEEAAPAEPTPAPPQPAPVPAPQPKPETAKPADERPRRRPDKAVAAAPTKPAAEKPRGSRLGPDFLKGLSPEKSAGKATTPSAATVSAQAMAGLAAAIAAQVKPCYVVPAGGTDSGNIVTVLRLRFNPDGSVSTAPSISEQSGVTEANRAYARQIGEAARRAVLRCSPLRLPADLYEGGWEDIEFVFNPRMMG